MNEKIPTITIVYDRYKKASPTRKASLEIRITYNGKQKYMSTGIHLCPNQWKHGKITNMENSLQVSEILNRKVSRVRQELMSMLLEGEVDIYSLANRIDERDGRKPSFMSFCAERASIRKYGIRKDSQTRYDRFLNTFIKWGKVKTFKDINEESVMSFDRYLTEKGMKPYSKWNNYHRFLNSFIRDAIDAGYLKKNPYKWVRIDKNKSSTGIGKYLTPQEFVKIINADMPIRHLEKVRDLFVFQTYTCLSYTDLKNFDKESVKTINNSIVYTGIRTKTGHPFLVPILLPAKNILDKYQWKLPIISNTKYNEYLKVVASMAGVHKPVSSHWARHTGATLLLNKGINLGIVSKICGHSSIRITEQVYAKLLDETIVSSVKAMGDLL